MSPSGWQTSKKSSAVHHSRCILKSILKHFLMQLFCTSLKRIKPKFLKFFLSKWKNLPWCWSYYLSVYAPRILLNSYRKLTKIRTLNFLEEFGIRIHWEISFIFKELFDRKVKQILERFWAFYQSIKEVKRKWSNLTSPNLYELWIIDQ